MSENEKDAVKAAAKNPAKTKGEKVQGEKEKEEENKKNLKSTWWLNSSSVFRKI